MTPVSVRNRWIYDLEIWNRFFILGYNIYLYTGRQGMMCEEVNNGRNTNYFFNNLYEIHMNDLESQIYP